MEAWNMQQRNYGIVPSRLITTLTVGRVLTAFISDLRQTMVWRGQKIPTAWLLRMWIRLLGQSRAANGGPMKNMPRMNHRKMNHAMTCVRSELRSPLNISNNMGTPENIQGQ